MALALGIDLSARRGLHLALLEGGRLLRTAHLPDVPATIAWVLALAPAATIGIDAPQGHRLPILSDPARRAALVPPPLEGRYLHHRVCDYQLARRGIALYLSPEQGQPVPNWMAVGFSLFEGLRAAGFLRPASTQDRAATLLEVYPYAAFVTLLGHIPPPKSTPEGAAARRATLVRAGIDGVPATMGHDICDAIVAAYVAAVYAAGGGCALGDPEEGLLVLPVTEHALVPRYRKDVYIAS